MTAQPPIFSILKVLVPFVTSRCASSPATITLQNPSLLNPSVGDSLRRVVEKEGYRGLWHGTSAGLLKTVPKYVTSVFVKDVIGDWQAGKNGGGEVGRREKMEQSFVKVRRRGSAGRGERVEGPGGELRRGLSFCECSST